MALRSIQEHFKKYLEKKDPKGSKVQNVMGEVDQ